MPGRIETRVWRADPTIHAAARYKRACQYQVFIPEPLTGLRFHLDGQLAGLVSDAAEAVRRLNAQTLPALAPLSRLLLRTESIASSRVEGLQVGAAQLARAEVKLASGQGVGRESSEILANIQAMELAIAETAIASEVGVEHILAIHHRLMAGDHLRRIAGKLRTTQNWIGGNDYNPCGADFVPPPPELVAPLLEDLCHAINDDLLPPLVQAALVHAQFETIHPFDDGNGRTGRALVHVVLRKRGVAPRYIPPVSVVLARGRQRYIDGLTRFRGEDVTAWIEQFVGVIDRAATLAESYVLAVRDLSNRWQAALRARAPDLRADATEHLMLECLVATPVVNSRMLRVATGRSEPSVHRAVRMLEEAGVLLRLSQGNRNRIWQVSGLPELIEQMDEGMTPV